VIGRQYLVRQAKTLLEFAKTTNDPDLAAVLVEKAAAYKSQLDRSSARDPTLRAPDVEQPPD
jgi:hypothetical protein